MPSLDDHGKLGAALIPFYVPILIASAIVVFRHGFGRNDGWVYLLIFSIGDYFAPSSSKGLLTISGSQDTGWSVIGRSTAGAAPQSGLIHRC